MPTYASCKRRFCAGVIDFIVFGIPYWILGHFWHATNYKLHVAVFWGAHCFYLVLTCLFFVSKWRASPGQIAVKIYIADIRDEKISFLRASWRYVLSSLPILPLAILMTTRWFYDVFHTLQGLSDKAAKHEYLMHSEHAMPILAYFIGWIVFFVLLTIFAWLPIVFTKQKTGLHDWGSGTRIYNKPSPSVANTQS